MASSRLIVAGETYTADDINNLRSDVLDTSTGHNHDGTDGRKTAFSDLDVTTGTAGSAAPSGGNHGYDDIDDHLDASQGQHGLAANVYVAGTHQAGELVQGGIVPFTGNSATITFPVSFGSDPAVVLTGVGTMGGIGEYLGFVITSLSESQAVVQKASDEPASAAWIAIGEGP